jgi:cation:H+ antiporter
LILINILLFMVGLFLLYVGALLLVGGSSRIALILKVSPIVVGLTIVAFGTSSPEFLVSFVAAFKGNMDVAVGNIVGSNIANIGLVLGLSVVLRPIVKLNINIKKELYWMTAVSLLFWLFAMDRLVNHIEGIILTLGIIIFTTILIRQSLKERKNPVSDEVPPIETGWKYIDNLSSKGKVIVFSLGSVLGIATLAYGSKVTIDSATEIALQLGVSQVIIGLTMVAFGTSLPELATGILSVIKKENEILIGNVIGSNLFNILGVAGPIGMVFSISFDEHIIVFDFPIMLAFTLLLFAVMLWKNGLGRFVSTILLIAYFVYIYWVVSH